MGFAFIPGKTVDVPEIPLRDELVLPAATTALVVMDMQNDFVSEGGNLRVPAAAETVPHIQALLEAARRAGARVAHTQDTQVEDDPEWEIWPPHCLQGTWGWETIEALRPRPGELVCYKNRYDGFYGTWLEHFLSYMWRVDHVVVAGTLSNVCVLHTAASAGMRWYHVVLAADTISALTEFDQALTLRQVTALYAGDVVRTAAGITFEP